jgi:hypothetical protein
MYLGYEKLEQGSNARALNEWARFRLCHTEESALAHFWGL